MHQSHMKFLLTCLTLQCMVTLHTHRICIFSTECFLIAHSTLDTHCTARSARSILHCYWTAYWCRSWLKNTVNVAPLYNHCWFELRGRGDETSIFPKIPVHCQCDHSKNCKLQHGVQCNLELTATKRLSVEMCFVNRTKGITMQK